MIIFYEKDTGIIIGEIDGRIHDESHLGMWVGNKDKIERIVCNWKPKSDKSGDYEPDNEQKDIYIELDKNPSNVYKYKVNLETLRLELK